VTMRTTDVVSMGWMVFVRVSENKNWQSVNMRAVKDNSNSAESPTME
jgi:hypothetical protein